VKKITLAMEIPITVEDFFCFDGKKKE